MSRSKTPYPNKGNNEFHKDSKGVFIVLSTNKQGGKSGGWEDKTTVGLLKKHLRLIMQILPTRRGGIEANQIDDALNSFLHIKRTGNTKSDDKLEDLYNHSKVVVVDGKVMYVGSDNIYPSYNEEHGVWVDDQPTIDGWLGGFFDPFWRMCKEPDEADLSGN
jgi:phosphatidylserine/phosphatidylglycerophosphate/cardiolipin synthase-like enzyme